MAINDELQNKVINIFERHRRGENFHFEVEEGGELIISPDGFNYVTFRVEKPETRNMEEVANHKHYIVKMLEVHKDGQDRVNHYYVPGDRLSAFMNTLEQRPGRVLEIKQFIPNITG